MKAERTIELKARTWVDVDLALHGMPEDLLYKDAKTHPRYVKSTRGKISKKIAAATEQYKSTLADINKQQDDLEASFHEAMAKIESAHRPEVVEAQALSDDTKRREAIERVKGVVNIKKSSWQAENDIVNKKKALEDEYSKMEQEHGDVKQTVSLEIDEEVFLQNLLEDALSRYIKNDETVRELNEAIPPLEKK